MVSFSFYCFLLLCFYLIFLGFSFVYFLFIFFTFSFFVFWFGFALSYSFCLFVWIFSFLLLLSCFISFASYVWLGPCFSGQFIRCLLLFFCESFVVHLLSVLLSFFSSRSGSYTPFFLFFRFLPSTAFLLFYFCLFVFFFLSGIEAKIPITDKPGTAQTAVAEMIVISNNKALLLTVP